MIILIAIKAKPADYAIGLEEYIKYLGGCQTLARNVGGISFSLYIDEQLSVIVANDLIIKLLNGGTAGLVKTGF